MQVRMVCISSIISTMDMSDTPNCDTSKLGEGNRSELKEVKYFPLSNHWTYMRIFVCCTIAYRLLSTATTISTVVVVVLVVGRGGGRRGIHGTFFFLFCWETIRSSTAID